MKHPILLSFFVSLLLSLSLSAEAEVPSGTVSLPLVTITNDQNTQKTVLSALVDNEDRVVGLYSAGGEGPDEAYWLKDIEKPEGVALLERQGRAVISVQGQLDRETQEGRLSVRYLANALFGSSRTCQFDLENNGDRMYVRNIYTGKIVKQVNVVTGTAGIKALQGLCPAQ
jgi:hypothetical protein